MAEKQAEEPDKVPAPEGAPNAMPAQENIPGEDEEEEVPVKMQMNAVDIAAMLQAEEDDEEAAAADA